MSILEKIAAVGRKPQSIPAAWPNAAPDLSARMLEIARERQRIDGEIREAAAAEHEAQARAVDLAERASAGTLDDPAKLTAALKAHRDAADRLTTLQAYLDRLESERAQLEPELRRMNESAAKLRYTSAVMEFAKACAPLLALAQEIRDAAPGANVLITDSNSPHLPRARSVMIGGAVIDVPAESGN